MQGAEVSPEYVTYKIFDDFIRDEEDPKVMVNNWNGHLEQWLMDIQSDANTYYCILIETAKTVTWWKWVLIAFNITLATAAILITTIALALGNPGIWLPIVDAVIAVLVAALGTLVEALGLNEWSGDCRQAAEDFIMLGRRIESQKRIPRKQRVESGIKFSNAASMRFEELRSSVPGIPARIWKKHNRLVQKPSTPMLKIPEQLLDYHAQEPEALGHDASGNLEEVLVDMEAPNAFEPVRAIDGSSETSEQTTPPRSSSQSNPTPPTPRDTLQNIFAERLQSTEHKREEEKALAKYEEFVRQQYLASSNQFNPPPVARRGSITMRGSVMHNLRSTRK